jgi:hypothetical protein
MLETKTDQYENHRDEFSERTGIGQPNQHNVGISASSRRLSTGAVRGLRS